MWPPRDAARVCWRWRTPPLPATTSTLNYGGAVGTGVRVRPAKFTAALAIQGGRRLLMPGGREIPLACGSARPSPQDATPLDWSNPKLSCLLAAFALLLAPLALLSVSEVRSSRLSRHRSCRYSSRRWQAVRSVQSRLISGIAAARRTTTQVFQLLLIGYSPPLILVDGLPITRSTSKEPPMRTIRNGLTGGRDARPAGKALRAVLLRVSAAVAVGAVVAVGCSSNPPSTESGGSTTTSPAPAVPVLAGTFRLDFDGSAQISGAGPTSDKIPPTTFAFRSTCSDNGCVATGSEVQPETPDTAVGPVVLDYLDGHWLMVKMTETSCGTYGTLSRMTVWELTPQPDGTLSGTRLNARLGSPDCVQAFRLPMRATRIGDVDAGVEIADPAQEAKRVPSPAENWRGS